MTETRLEYLFNRYYEKTATADEKAALMNLLGEHENDAAVKDMIDRVLIKTGPEMELDNANAGSILLAILNADVRQPAVVRPIKRLSFARVAAAAVILLLLSVGGYFYFKNDTEKQIAKTETQQQYKNDIASPQTNKAILTLSDGTTIVLDSAGDGSLAVQGNVNVVKTADGQIVYNGDATEIKYNTLTVPKGSKPVQLQLADGSNVWLNVASSITYPTAFINKERKVQITGEAYFEVAHNAAMPFVVQKNDISVQVLGTHFNVNTYDDENEIKITLLEGSVKVSKGNKTNLIKPGQQAQLNKIGEIKIITADVEQAVAWKNGKFQFGEGADIASVMRQVARWYDVEIEYQGSIKGHIGGTISRSVNASQVFKMLEMTGGMKFKIEGKKVVVMP